MAAEDSKKNYQDIPYMVSHHVAAQACVISCWYFPPTIRPQLMSQGAWAVSMLDMLQET